MAGVESPERKNVYVQYSMSPGMKTNSNTSRKSFGSISTFGSLVTKQRNENVSISDCPEFSGKA